MGRLAVVTGASSGIGAATARLLGREGWTVVLVARTRTRLEAVAAEIVSAGGVAVVEALDGSDGPAVVELARRVVAVHGAPDLVVNSAGAGVWRWVEDTSPAMALEMMGAPYLAAFYVTHAFLPSMMARKAGVIVHVNSPASVRPWASSAAYAASRSALRALSEVLDLDLRGTGVRSCHVVFGEVSSGYFENNPESHDYIPWIGRMIPISTPERCAEVIRGLAERPRREVFYPAMLWVTFQVNRLFPGIFRALVAATGRRR